MSAYRRGARPNEPYRIEPVLPGFGRVGPWSTGFQSRRQAEQVEAFVYECALTRPDIIQALLRKEFNLRELWVAKMRGGLDDLMLNVNDPTLAASVEAYKLLVNDERTLQGLAQIVEYAPNGSRVSWLRGKNLSEMYARACVDRKPNSVRRSLHVAVTKLLLHELKEDGRRKALDGVIVPGEDDTRTVSVDAEQTMKLIEACSPEPFRYMVIAAIASAIDRKPLLALTPRHLNEKEGTVEVPDKKTASRPRLLRVNDITMTALLIAARGKDRNEKLFPWNEWGVRSAFNRAREKAGVDVRFKDLRHLLPTVLAQLGVDRREIQAYMGHAVGSKQTDRYITPTGDVAILNEAASLMGLDRSYLKVG